MYKNTYFTHPKFWIVCAHIWHLLSLQSLMVLDETACKIAMYQ